MQKAMAIKIAIGIIILLVASFFIFGFSDNFSSPEGTTQTALKASPTPGKLKIEDIKIGTGEASVKKGDTIIIQYTGKLAENGKVFDSSYDRNQPFTTQIGVGQVIKGWDEGVIGMKVGGKRRLTIPPDLGYGAQGAGESIPPNATLIFDLELVGIQ